jgi:hypothetical protein
MEKRQQLPKVTTSTTRPASEPEIIVGVQSTQAVLTVTAPIKDWDEGFVRKNLNIVLTRDQAKVLKQIQLGLEEVEAKLNNEKYVATAVDAIRWMLENAAPGNATS